MSRILVSFTLVWACLLGGLWIRSSKHTETLFFGHWRGGNNHLLIDRGHIKLIWTNAREPAPSGLPWWISYTGPGRKIICDWLAFLTEGQSRLGIEWGVEQNPPPPDNKGIFSMHMPRFWWLNDKCA